MTDRLTDDERRAALARCEGIHPDSDSEWAAVARTDLPRALADLTASEAEVARLRAAITDAVEWCEKYANSADEQERHHALAVDIPGALLEALR